MLSGRERPQLHRGLRGCGNSSIRQLDLYGPRCQSGVEGLTHHSGHLGPGPRRLGLPYGDGKVVGLHENPASQSACGIFAALEPSSSIVALNTNPAERLTSSAE